MRIPKNETIENVTGSAMSWEVTTFEGWLAREAKSVALQMLRIVSSLSQRTRYSQSRHVCDRAHHGGDKHPAEYRARDGSRLRKDGSWTSQLGLT